MNEAIIRNHNERVGPNDTVYHIGDFCFRACGNTGNGQKVKALTWEKRLNGKIVFLKGNHDSKNGLKRALHSAIIKMAGKTIYMVHIPPYSEEDIPPCDLVLAGHVHEKWKYITIETAGHTVIPVINVGVDQWGFKPINIQEILKLYNRIKGK